MKFRTLIRRSLRFHWRSHLGVVLGAAIGSAALIGALVVGDSVQGSLRDRVRHRLGEVGYAMRPLDRFVTDNLANGMMQPMRNGFGPGGYDSGWDIPPSTFAGFGLVQPLQALVLNATAARVDGAARANRIQLIGAPSKTSGNSSDTWFFHYFGFGIDSRISAGSVWVNEALAEKLKVTVGDEVLFKVTKATALSGEIAISSRDNQLNSLRLRVEKILPSSSLADFDLNNGSQTSLNVFVNRQELQDAAGLPGRVNLLLQTPLYETGRGLHHSIENLRNNRKVPDWIRSSSVLDALVANHEGEPSVALSKLSEMLQACLKLTDLESELRINHARGEIDLVSRRIFLDPPIIRSASKETPNTQLILTYLATVLRAGTNATPYSMVTAAGAPWTPAGMRDDEIVVSQWLADDLQVKPGDEIAMSYFLPESGARLEEATNTFRVHSIVPPEMPWADRTLMPDFPGIEKAESTSEWDAGFPLTYKVRPKDDEYWKQHRGTPKAFITLAAGQKLWGNRFGNLTAIRFPIPTNSPSTNFQTELEAKILANLKPEELGLRFEPVREQALKAAEGSQDFGGLFLGFSFFVIAAALLLMAMLFQFGLEQRGPEIGTLLALGFTPKQVRNLFLREGVMLALLGGVLGAIGGIYFAKGMLQGLNTIWRDAVGATSLNFHVTGQTLLIGVLASVIISTLTIWLALRKFVKRPARELLVGDIGSEDNKTRNLKSKITAVGALLTVLVLVGWALATGDTSNAGIFFGAGALVLISGLSFANAWLVQLGGARGTGPEAGTPITTASLAIRGCVRRRKRSLGTMAMLACGSFLIVSIGVFRLDANRDATQKTSGTGGFALIGETTLPVVQDLNSASGRDFFALNEQDLVGVNVVPFRVRQGDEASCLNLNAAQKPRLLGVKPGMLGNRFSFAKKLNETTKIGPWGALERFHLTLPLATNEIPAIGDANSIQWAMKKKVGDTIDYVDERGQLFKVRIIGAVANSILQGQLIIDEAEFVKRFPGESGYRMFLIDAPSNSVSQVSATLSRAMQDVGLELTPTVTRLNQFNAVQNTYLGTFQVLGGLGLLLGSVGLGIVVLRNVLERRSELAVLLAVGFRKAEVQRLVLLENGALLLAGLGLGVIAATIAVLPAVLSPAGQLPYASLAITLLAVLLNGALWTWTATRYAVRGDLLAALRNE